MSVADTIQELATDIGNAYDEVQTKGGTIPQNKNTNNLATAIGTIPTGTTPTGTLNITQNGTYDVTDKASADVAVPTLELIKTYTVPTSWENDTDGNPMAIYNVLFSDVATDINYCYFAVFDGNNASRYITNYICYSSINSTSSAAYGYTIRNINQTRTNALNTSSWASIGTVIKLYKMRIVEVE